MRMVMKDTVKKYTRQKNKYEKNNQQFLDIIMVVRHTDRHPYTVKSLSNRKKDQ